MTVACEDFQSSGWLSVCKNCGQHFAHHNIQEDECKLCKQIHKSGSCTCGTWPNEPSCGHCPLCGYICYDLDRAIETIYKWANELRGSKQ